MYVYIYFIIKSSYFLLLNHLSKAYFIINYVYYLLFIIYYWIIQLFIIQLLIILLKIIIYINFDKYYWLPKKEKKIFFLCVHKMTQFQECFQKIYNLG